MKKPMPSGFFNAHSLVKHADFHRTRFTVGRPCVALLFVHHSLDAIIITSTRVIRSLIHQNIVSGDVNLLFFIFMETPTGNRTQLLRHSYHPTTFSSLILLLLVTQIRHNLVLAQLQQPPSLAVSASTIPASPTDINPLLASPTNGDTSSIPTLAPAVPSATDHANYTASTKDDGTSDKGVLDYYFLLILVFVIIIFLVYWSIARRRKKRIANLRNHQQSALARDVESWPGRRNRVGGRWRMMGVEVDPRAQEGLDERGEAPPPYLKEPEPAHHDARAGLEMHDMGRNEGKPPEYEAGPSGR